MNRIQAAQPAVAGQRSTDPEARFAACLRARRRARRLADALRRARGTALRRDPGRYRPAPA